MRKLWIDTNTTGAQRLIFSAFWRRVRTDLEQGCNNEWCHCPQCDIANSHQIFLNAVPPSRVAKQNANNGVNR